MSQAEAVEQVERLVEQRAAGHGDREAVSAQRVPSGSPLASAGQQRPVPRSSPASARCSRSTPEREADGGQVAPEAPEQVVVAAAAADRRAERGVVDLEDRARVVAELRTQAEVEDHPLRRRPARAARAPRAGPSTASASAWAGASASTSGAAAALRHARAAARRPRSADPELARAAARARRSRAARAPASSAARAASGTPQAGQQRREQRRVAEADAVVLQAGRVERVAEHRQRLRGALRARATPISSIPACSSSRGWPALRAHAAVAVGEVAEAQRRLGRRRSAWRPRARSAPSCPSAAPAPRPYSSKTR